MGIEKKKGHIWAAISFLILERKYKAVGFLCMLPRSGFCAQYLSTSPKTQNNTHSKVASYATTL